MLHTASIRRLECETWGVVYSAVFDATHSQKYVDTFNGNNNKIYLVSLGNESNRRRIPKQVDYLFEHHSGRAADLTNVPVML